MTTTTNTRSENSFFEVRLNIFAGSNQRVAFDKKALASMGFNQIDFDAVKAMLQTAVLPKEAFYSFLAIRKSVQDFLSTKGVNHDLMGRVFNPQERIEIVTFLKEKQTEYMEEKNKFLMQYSAFTAEQLEKVENSAVMKGLDPKPLVEAVRKNQPKSSYYDSKLDFRFLDLSITLDSEQWAEEIEKINEDIVARTVYETERDANEIRDTDNPRGKAKALLSLASRFKSLDFYVPGLNKLANEVETLVSNLGGLKPAKNYEAKEVMMLTGAAKVVSQNAHALIHHKMPLADFMDSEAGRIEAMFADEDQDSLDLSGSNEEVSKETEVSHEEMDMDSDISSVPPQTNQATSVGLFNF
ncbi:hypothetical protein JCM30760_26920 [Thiomicrorhabdus hydrogeniphila]